MCDGEQLPPAIREFLAERVGQPAEPSTSNSGTLKRSTKCVLTFVLSGFLQTTCVPMRLIEPGDERIATSFPVANGILSRELREIYVAVERVDDGVRMVE